MIYMDTEKMSKSLGNFVTIYDLLKLYPADVVRLFIIQTHYPSPITFNEEAIVQAKTTAERLFDTIILS